MKSVQEILQEKFKNSTKDIVLVGADAISQHGYTLVPNHVLLNNQISGRAKLVYALLLSYAWGEKNSSFPGQNRLAKECGSSAKSVWSAIQELEDTKFITIIRRGQGKTNLYFLHFKKIDEQEDVEKDD